MLLPGSLILGSVCYMDELGARVISYAPSYLIQPLQLFTVMSVSFIIDDLNGSYYDVNTIEGEKIWFFENDVRLLVVLK